jgi:membrane protein required for colicin V production
MENINVFDIIVIALIALLGLKGFFRGFIKEFFALFGIIGGVFVASRVASEVGEIVIQIIPFDNDKTKLLVGFVIALIGFWLLAYIVGMILSKVFSLSGLGIFDRIAGFIFGAGKVFLIFSIIIYAVTSIQSFQKLFDKKFETSKTYPILKQAGGYIVQLDTTQFQGQVSKSVNSAVENTKEVIKDISVDAIKQNIEETKEVIEQKVDLVKENIENITQTVKEE